MRIKRWVCALLCLLLLTGLMPAGVVRADAVHQNFEYRLDEAGNVTITGYRDKSVTDLEVPEKILGHPVTVILGNTFRSCEALRSLVLPESLQTMLDNLQNCRNLERIYVYSPEMDLWGALTNARIYTHLEKTPMSLVSTKNYCPFEEFGFDPRTQPVFTEGCMTYALHEGEACLLEAKPEGDFTVPDTLGGCPVTRIAPCCFLGASMLRGLTLPDTVRIIGRGALQPEYGAEETVNELKLLVKQGAGPDDLREVLDARMATAFHPGIMSALGRLQTETVRWAGVSHGVLN